MVTMGSIKARIAKVLGEYSKNGTVVSTSAFDVADMYLKMGTAVDMSFRKIASLCGLLSEGSVSVTMVSGQAAEINVPSGFIEVTSIKNSSGDECCYDIQSYVSNGKLKFSGGSAGSYTVSYAKYPDSLESAADSAYVCCDDYVADILVYYAASELCERDDPELYSRLKYKADELLLNRFNVEKSGIPPYNRVYGVVRKKATKWLS